MTRLPDYVQKKNLGYSVLQEDAPEDIAAALAKAKVDQDGVEEDNQV